MCSCHKCKHLCLQGGDTLHEDDQNISNEPSQSGEMAPENKQAEHKENSADDNSEKEEEESEDEDDPELEKRLTKQRQRAIQAARGRRKAITSRNSYKDKGGRSSHNSKIQTQLSSW